MPVLNYLNSSNLSQQNHLSNIVNHFVKKLLHLSSLTWRILSSYAIKKNNHEKKVKLMVKADYLNMRDLNDT